jgi:hypothetical protein
MKKFLTRGLVASAGVGVAVLGISAGSAFAANPTTQGARAAVETVGTWGFNPVSGPNGNVSFNSYVTNTLNTTTGDLTTTVHLQGAQANTVYYGNIYVQGFYAPLGTSVRIVTNGQGNGEGTAVNNNAYEVGYNNPITPTSQVSVEMFNSGYNSFLQSVFAPVSAIAS